MSWPALAMAAALLVSGIALGSWLMLPADFVLNRVLLFPVQRAYTVSEGVTELIAVTDGPDGGRVLGVTACGENLDLARERCYQAINKIHFEGAFWRRDIGDREAVHQRAGRAVIIAGRVGHLGPYHRSIAAPRRVLFDRARAEQTEGRRAGRRGEMHLAGVIADERGAAAQYRGGGQQIGLADEVDHLPRRQGGEERRRLRFDAGTVPDAEQGIDAVMQRKPGEHELYGVLDPDSKESTAGASGVGRETWKRQCDGIAPSRLSVANRR